MISGVFIDRPRLAFVVSIVITLAGVLALLQITGVDNALYYQSASAADGSYNLTVTFAIGTDPDINTVNVQNRAQLATPLLPQEVQRQGLVIRKKSAALLQVITLYSPKKTYDALYLNNYATINVIDPLSRVRGVGQAQ